MLCTNSYVEGMRTISLISPCRREPMSRESRGRSMPECHAFLPVDRQIWDGDSDPSGSSSGLRYDSDMCSSWVYVAPVIVKTATESL